MSPVYYHIHNDRTLHYTLLQILYFEPNPHLTDRIAGILVNKNNILKFYIGNYYGSPPVRYLHCLHYISAPLCKICIVL